MTDEEANPFYVGNKVRKASGYAFKGEVVGVVHKLNGQTRYVVECTVPGCEGMLHIFRHDQLKDDSNED